MTFDNNTSWLRQVLYMVGYFVASVQLSNQRSIQKSTKVWILGSYLVLMCPIGSNLTITDQKLDSGILLELQYLKSMRVYHMLVYDVSFNFHHYLRSNDIFMRCKSKMSNPPYYFAKQALV